jgi:hypothetical protein
LIENGTSWIVSLRFVAVTMTVFCRASASVSPLVCATATGAIISSARTSADAPVERDFLIVSSSQSLPSGLPD